MARKYPIIRITSTLMDTPFLQPLFIALAIGAASGAIGSFVILRRMALVGDALSHVALPGIALALLLSIDPFWGLLVFLLAGACLVWYLELKSRLPTEALVGILFTASLAIGILAIPDTELIESLFGEFPALSSIAFFATVGAAILVAFLSFLFARRFLFATVSTDLAKVAGIAEGTNLLLLLVFAFAVALGIKLVGTLLMGALTIIPAAAAKNISRGMGPYMILSTVLGGVIGAGGLLIAQSFNFLPGPTIVLFGVALFLLTLAARKR